MHPAMKLEFVYDVPPYALFEPLTEQKMWRAFTQSDASFKLQVGAPFKLWSGMVEGEVQAFEKSKSLTLKWRFNDWKDDDYSLVEINLKEGDAKDTTICTLNQSKVPKKGKSGQDIDPQGLKKGWHSQVFESISKIIGFPLKSYKLNI